MLTPDQRQLSESVFAIAPVLNNYSPYKHEFNKDKRYIIYERKFGLKVFFKDYYDARAFDLTPYYCNPRFVVQKKIKSDKINDLFFILIYKKAFAKMLYDIQKDLPTK